MKQLTAPVALAICTIILCLSVYPFGQRLSRLFVVAPAFADEVDDLQKQIDDLEHLKKLSVDATKPLEKEVSTLESRINSARAGIQQAKKQAETLSKTIDQREEDLSYQYQVLAVRVAQQYRRSRLFSPLMLLFASDDATQLTKDLAYRDSVRAQDNQLIKSIGADIATLETDKTKLESDQKRLASLEQQLDVQADFFKGEIAKAKTYQQQLTGQIAALSAQQQSIINARSGTTTTSVGDVPLADDFNASIGYKAQAPSNSFAVFSFGAYTHRKGMSQYGAKKQAESGKNYKDIVQWYYGHGVKKEDGVPGTISVQGYGEMSFQKYLYGIAEMPSGWHGEALKAQAVAARTFAYKSGKPICTTEACQVFNKSKSDNPPESWKKAVDETEKEIIDGDVTSQYSSTAGGYLTTTGWDTTDRNGDGNWSSKAWESMAGSPWFYKSWYRSGYSSSGANCGRAHPWLSQEEFSDIVNAWIVRKSPNGADVNRIQPVTINECNIGGGGGNPYSMSELRDKANGSGGAVTSVSAVTVSNNSTGQTTNVKLQTNRGEINIPGSEFKETYNLRAPGYLRIPQSGFAFYNIEKK